jgi:hypothetical protein
VNFKPVSVKVLCMESLGNSAFSLKARCRFISTVSSAFRLHGYQMYMHRIHARCYLTIIPRYTDANDDIVIDNWAIYCHLQMFETRNESSRDMMLVKHSVVQSELHTRWKGNPSYTALVGACDQKYILDGMHSFDAFLLFLALCCPIWPTGISSH